jgi:hypothetical protein
VQNLKKIIIYLKGPETRAVMMLPEDFDSSKLDSVAAKVRGMPGVLKVEVE